MTPHTICLLGLWAARCCRWGQSESRRLPHLPLVRCSAQLEWEGLVILRLRPLQPEGAC